MPYHINSVEKDQCVHLACELELDEAQTQSAGQAVKALLAAKAWCRVVVDGTRLPSLPHAVELLEFSEGFFSDLPRGVRIALVVRGDQLRPARFIETIARNRGVLAACFTGVEDATIWVNLLEPVAEGA